MTQRLVAVTGYNERVNDVIFVERKTSTDTDPASVVVFFGGDVQVCYFNYKYGRNYHYLFFNLF
jgi:hypothetical protein